MVNAFIDDVYYFMDDNKDLELNRYGDIFIENDIEWGSESMSSSEIAILTEQCIMALVMGAVRAERFCDGALLGFSKDGSIFKWLERLKEIDDA